jgi:hypothetical protein
MTPHTNGTLPHPTPITRIPVADLVVRDTRPLDAGMALLSELDDLIATLEAAMQDAATARDVITGSEFEMEIIAASLALTCTAPAEWQRRHAITFALSQDAGYQAHAQTVRHARASLYTAERRIAIVKARMQLVHAAIALLVGSKEG